MTAPAPAISLGLPRPAADDPVTEVDDEGIAVPRYGDDRWDLRGLTRRASSPHIWIDFNRIPERHRTAAKEITWSWLNHRTPTDQLERTTAVRERLSPSSIVATYHGDLIPFLIWLDARGIARLRDVTEQDLDAFMTSIHELSIGRSRKAQRLFAVSRIWLHNPYLSPGHRLIRPQWEDADARDFLGPSDWTAENKTPPIHPQVMSPLLVWALRFVDEFAPDILAAIELHDRLVARTREKVAPGDRAIVAGYRRRLLETGEATPGFTRTDGQVGIAQHYLAATLGVGTMALHRHRFLPDVPIVLGAPLDIPMTSRFDDSGAHWRDAIDWYEVSLLRCLLATASLIVTAYLSGIRSGEVRELRRGCCVPHPGWDGAPPHFTISGLEFKGATDEDGNAIPGGRQRDEPWYVIAPVARAIAVAESLSPSDLVFDNAIFAGTHRYRAGAVDAHTANLRVGQFVAWANAYAAENERPHELIPEDDDGAITLVRFRRTLAWFIYRLPGGRVALGVQYGHLRGYTSEGYGMRTRSGLRDVFPMEEARSRIDGMLAAKERLDGGEGVSGPAAARYIEGLEEVGRVFPGGFVSQRGLRALQKNPLLRIYDNGMQHAACCYDATKSLCHPDRERAPDPPRSPALARCDPRCPNEVRTDSHIEALTDEIHRHDVAADSPLLPEPLRKRHRQRVEAIASIIEWHEQERRTAP